MACIVSEEFISARRLVKKRRAAPPFYELLFGLETVVIKIMQFVKLELKAWLTFHLDFRAGDIVPAKLRNRMKRYRGAAHFAGYYNLHG